MDIASSMSILEENFTLVLLNCSNAVRSLAYIQSTQFDSFGQQPIAAFVCNCFCFPNRPAPAARNWWGYDVLPFLIAILFMLSPLARNVNKVGAPLGTKMLRECIDGADVEPPKAIRGFVLYHPCDDALVDNDCGNLLQAAWDGSFFWDCGHLVWVSVSSPLLKKF